MAINRMLRTAASCASTVPESNAFNPFELSLSEKQIPRFVGNVSSYKKWTELLESRGVRARQARFAVDEGRGSKAHDPENPHQTFRIRCLLWSNFFHLIGPDSLCGLWICG